MHAHAHRHTHIHTHLHGTLLYYAEEYEVMKSVQRRLDTVELMPADSEDQMVNELLAWRNANNNESTNGDREDSCINGYGIARNNPAIT